MEFDPPTSAHLTVYCNHHTTTLFFIWMTFNFVLLHFFLVQVLVAVWNVEALLANCKYIGVKGRRCHGFVLWPKPWGNISLWFIIFLCLFVLFGYGLCFYVLFISCFIFYVLCFVLFFICFVFMLFVLY